MQLKKILSTMLAGAIITGLINLPHTVSASSLSSQEDMQIISLEVNEGAVSISSLKIDAGILKYELEQNGDISNYDVYAAVYDSKGELVHLTKNEMLGEMSIGASNSYTLKVMMWNKDSVNPTSIYPDIQTIDIIEKIMETKYLFTDSKVIKTSGSASSGSVYEWVITSTPQYFYIDTIDFDDLKSVEIRSGYDKNSAVTSIYAYDNGGVPVSEETLKGFLTNSQALGEAVGTIADSKSTQWGYRTGVVAGSGVTISDGANYTLLNTSKSLSVPVGAGKKALIVGISGDIGTKGYFDYIKVNYNKGVDAPMPEIESITGEGIKDNTVEINSADKSVVIPVMPGTNLDTLNPTIKIKDNASVKLTDGAWKDGKLTITYGELTEVWSVRAEDRGNPVLNGYYADPNICVFGDTFYIYPTTDGGTGWNSTSFKAFSSKDLVNWKDEGEILSLTDVKWSSGLYAWAPTAVEKEGKYYYYYSGTQSIGVAVADSPTGPFIDKGEPLVDKNTIGLSGQMIDPAAFIDDDGQAYIYWGNGKMYAAKLSDDMMSIDGEIHTITPSNFREGVFVVKRGDKYYFTWSNNDTGEPTYEVRYGTSTSPLGPISGNTKILSYSNTDDSRIRGTGHHSIVNVPGTDEWYICYHRFNVPRYGDITAKNSEAGNHREVCIDKLEFDTNGNIKPVLATLKGITEPVTIENPELQKYVVINGDKNIYLKNTYTYTARTSDSSSVEWSVSDETVASISQDGLLTPLKEGNVTVTATSATAGTKSINITIQDADRLAVESAVSSIYMDKDIYGNINMPSKINNVTVTWLSSDISVISNDGTVSRGDSDISVNLTAIFTSGEQQIEKNYTVTVKARAVNKSEEDMAAYLFVHFVGTEGSANDEQIYFSVSKDGKNWNTLKDNAPILTSTVGEKGVRDPHIIRSPEGDKFFLIATDLSIYGRRSDSNRWATCQTSGSKSIVIWESTDLVNWSEARIVKVADDKAGCTWAPESIYDDETGRYMVFWASKVSTDNYATQRIYRSYTHDFRTFTEPEIYMNGENISNIDTSFIKDNGVYYRFTKNESNSSVIMEKGASLDGEFEPVETYSINGVAGNTITGYEGPTAYKLNGENKWCLLLDYYSKSQGYKPFMTDDISTGVFTSAENFNFDTKYRHGTVMPITQEEYDALLEKYTIVDEEESGYLIFSLDFDDESATPSLGSAKVNGTITYAEGYKGMAASLDQSDYIELTKDKDGKNLLAGLESFTVSFASKTNATSWWFYAAGDSAAQTYKSEKYLGVLDSGSKLTCERYNSNKMDRPASASGSYTTNTWKHITVVYRNNSYTLYIDGKQVSKVSSSVELSTMLGLSPIIYIGKANWGNGEYSNGMIDEFKIYNYAQSDEEVASNYTALLN